MSTITVFVPSFLTEGRDGYLYGIHIGNSSENSEVFYVFDVGPRITRECIGYYCTKFTSIVPSVLPHSANWISLKLTREDFVITNIICSQELINLETCRGIICIVYDYSKFLRSEILIKHSNGRNEREDHFQKLAQYIQKRNSFSNSCYRSRIFSSLSLLFAYSVIFTQKISFHFSKLTPILKYSSLATQVKHYIDDACWALSTVKKEKRVSIRVGNYVASTALDVCAGVFFLSWMMSIVTAESLPQLLLDTAEVVVETLLDLLKWLMGVPAGLKLNFAWNNILGRFFMYHIKLWWTFLVITKPLLEFTFRVFLLIGQFGVTFQVSILADLFALVSFHVYCIYVYAARLYNLQVMGLIALWRLFIGKKWNPLRERVDSCTYSSEQLFVGTVSFTILFFLLPTTVMYYIVFASLRLMALMLGGLLRKVRFLVQSIPLYSSFLWLLGGDSITSTVELVALPSRQTPLGNGTLSQITLSVSPTTQSWWATVCACMPLNHKSLAQEDKLGWSDLFRSFFYGQLIYPV
ncbi:hypothetical protein J437_LFUL008455 [Ladona fulva]|uniref:Phosphatidylinositol N-acetylglucosaminyltransferase subunit Q n=1 Tax=Ladona fulva TaxID=123851 RepID=A0A8K0P3V3_LADFU|nr:hypothetical protein J437_LFUL008455 [Ladona fulva]